MASPKVPTRITYVHPGAQPPIYLAGSFSKPPWQPQEMEYTTTEEGQFHFSKTIDLVPEQKYQYKFRLGPGDWWVLDETAPVAVDAAGNRNNTISAPPVETRADSQQSLPSKPKETSSEPNKLPIPTVVVQKTDTEPRHGDDFGSHATIGQKDAHEMRAADATPDYTVIRPDEDVAHDEADTAAEVADSAAIIDEEPSSEPVSDEEAGRTGERRMSMTPIGQVADTASEVADSAALIDRDGDDDEAGESIDRVEFARAFPHMARHASEGAGSGTATPKEDKAPLFAYECIGPYEGPEHDPEHEEGGNNRLHEENAEYDIQQEYDPNDPSIEEFPEERMQILTKISTTESRLSADQTKFDGIPMSPVVGADGTPLGESFVEVVPDPSATSPLDLAREPSSPLLDIINEDEEEEQVSTSDGASASQSAQIKINADEGNQSKSTTENILDRVLPTKPFLSDESRDAIKAKAVQISEPANGSGQTGKSSALDEETSNINGKVKQRRTDLPERPRSAQSIRPASEESGKPSRTWLAAIWNTVVVGWFGGLIKRLFAGRPRQ